MASGGDRDLLYGTRMNISGMMQVGHDVRAQIPGDDIERGCTRV